MKRICMILLAIFFIASCGKDENAGKTTCELSDPIEELPWLKEIKNSLTNCSCEISILQATYKNQTVFYTAMTDPLCDGVQTIILLDCEGKVIRSIPNDDIQSFHENATNIKALYRCKKSQ